MKRKISVKAVILIIILVAAACLFMFAATLRITKITYEGCENTSGEEIEKYFFEKDIDKNPFLFFFHSHFQEHEEIPFVEEYEVDMVSLTEFKVTVYEKSIIGYLKYMGQCMYFDKDGIVVETTSKELEGIVPVEGIDFDHIVVNEKIPVDNEETFDTILAVTQLIHNYQIAVDKIDISKELEITLYISQVRVELGKNSAELSGKINDLSSITEVMDDVSGVLDMREYSQSDKGYTFKRD